MRKTIIISILTLTILLTGCVGSLKSFEKRCTDNNGEYNENLLIYGNSCIFGDQDHADYTYVVSCNEGTWIYNTDEKLVKLDLPLRYKLFQSCATTEKDNRKYNELPRTKPTNAIDYSENRDNMVRAKCKEACMIDQRADDFKFNKINLSYTCECVNPKPINKSQDTRYRNKDYEYSYEQSTTGGAEGVCDNICMEQATKRKQPQVKIITTPLKLHCLCEFPDGSTHVGW